MKIMKNISILMILLISFNFVIAQNYENGGVLDINFINQDPDPVEPGEYVDVRWKMENLGDETLENVEIEFVATYPFSVDENPVKSYAKIDSQIKDDAGIIIKYKVRVDENAIEGSNLIKIKYRSDDSTWTTQEYDINVQTVDANLGIMSIETVPTNILPGDEFELRIKVKNLADSTINDVNMKLDLLLSTITTGSMTTTKSDILDSLPFAPTKSATEKKIRNIKQGEEVVFTYSLIAYADAEAKVYKIPIELGYYDGIGTQYAKEDIVGIIIQSKPDLRVILESSEISAQGTKGEVSVKFVNKGLTDVKLLNVMLKESDNYDIISPSEVYIGNIESDDYESADFEIYAKVNNLADLPIPVTYEYMDANNNKIVEESTLNVKLCTEGDPSCTEKKNNKNAIYGLVAVLIIVGFFIVRAILKRKK
jgi:hypothetical protein